MMVIFPKGVQYLAFHKLNNFFISSSIFSTFWSEILLKLLMSYEMPKQSNLEVHSRFKLLQNFLLLLPTPLLLSLSFYQHSPLDLRLIGIQ